MVGGEGWKGSGGEGAGAARGQTLAKSTWSIEGRAQGRALWGKGHKGPSDCPPPSLTWRGDRWLVWRGSQVTTWLLQIRHNKQHNDHVPRSLHTRREPGSLLSTFHALPRFSLLRTTEYRYHSSRVAEGETEACSKSQSWRGAEPGSESALSEAEADVPFCLEQQRGRRGRSSTRAAQAIGGRVRTRTQDLHGSQCAVQGLLGGSVN